MKKKILIISIALVLVSASFIAGFVMKTEKSTAAAPAMLPFGGHLLLAEDCECSQAFELYYLPAMPLANFPAGGGWLAYDTKTTIVYSYYNMITPGVWHMGLYIPGRQSCWSLHRGLCLVANDMGTIFEAGTSLVPSH